MSDDEQPTWWWITNPRGHREYDQAQPKPDEIEFAGQMVPVIHVDPGEEWVCDYCNNPIPLTNPNTNRPVPVPMEDNSALCPDCMRQSLIRHGKQVHPLSWTSEPGQLSVCACPPCRALAAAIEMGGMHIRN